MNFRFQLYALALCGGAMSHAATISVTSLADSGAGSLRAAVTTAASGDTINVVVAGTMTLTSGEIAVTKALSIAGPGSSSLTVSGNGSSRIFKVSVTAAGAVDAPVSISGMTLTSGYAAGTCSTPATGSGGAIAATESLSLTDVAITSSYATRNGGGIAWALRRSGQQLTLTSVRLSGNTAGCASATAGAMGGALFAGYDASATAGSSGTVLVSGSTIAGNTAQRSGGGIALVGPVTLSVTDSRVVTNTATAAFGGGVYLAPPSVTTLTTPQATFVSSEIAENTAALAGGGIAAVNALGSLQASGYRSALTLTNSTVSGNVVTAANADSAAINLAANVTLNLFNSTVAFNQLATVASGASIARSVCSGSVEPLTNLSSSIVAQTNNATSGYSDISDGGVVFTQPWAVSNSLVRQSIATLSGSNNLTGVDPQLVTLAWNGGSTRSHTLASTSPVINAGSNPNALTTDQRGAVRTYGVATDMGAVESPFALASACTFDVDGDGVIGATTDGTMISRIIAGFSGSAITADAASASATRNTWSSIDNYVTACGYRLPTSACSFDLDGDNQMSLTTDSVLLSRVLAGVNLDGVTVNATNPGGSRATWNALKTHLNANCGFALQ